MRRRARPERRELYGASWTPILLATPIRAAGTPAPRSPAPAVPSWHVVELENVSVLVGVRGRFQPRTPRIGAEALEVAISDAFNRWGFPVGAWGPCDSGADPESPEPDAMRGWAHFELVSPVQTEDLDLPVQGFARTTWDALELFGQIDLAGLDAIVPTACAGDRMWARVAGSVLRGAGRASNPRAHARIQAGRAWREAPAAAGDSRAILDVLSELVEISAAMDEVALAAYPAGPRVNPFVPREDDPVRAEVLLPAWTLDDAAWLAEAMCVSCRRAGVAQDLLLSVRIGTREH